MKIHYLKLGESLLVKAEKVVDTKYSDAEDSLRVELVEMDDKTYEVRIYVKKAAKWELLEYWSSLGENQGKRKFEEIYRKF